MTENRRTAATEAELPELIRVELWLNTAMWNEGFELASDAWFRIYTDNGDWARNLPRSYSVKLPRDFFAQDFGVRVDELNPRWEPPTQDDLDEEDYDEDDYEDGEERPISTRQIALRPGLSSEDLDALLATRLSEWDGI